MFKNYAICVWESCRPQAHTFSKSSAFFDFILMPKLRDTAIEINLKKKKSLFLNDLRDFIMNVCIYAV